ncbi:MAG: hypothetical protein JXB49_08125 [Bacteroidales bacterium]|nr:hypothetical protein [Bacteroidales bacterium]
MKKLFRKFRFLIIHSLRLSVGPDNRSQRLKKNIVGSIFVKGASIIVNLLLVSVTLNYLNQTNYGIWLTLTSFVTWVSFFDIGLGSGLRNKLAVSLANNNIKEAKILVSTSYAFLLIVACSLTFLFIIVNHFLSWSEILNSGKEMHHVLFLLSFFVFISFFLNFVLRLIVSVFYADQKQYLGDLYLPVSNLIVLIIIWISSGRSLLYYGIVYSVVPTIVLIMVSYLAFSGKYRSIKPSINHVKFKYGKELISLGSYFFIIQIAGVIMYQTTNVIISQYFGPSQVTPYNIAFKLFSILNMGFSILLAPLWSAYTEAWVKNDYGWIERSVKKMKRIWLFVSLVGLIILLNSKWIYRFWVGDKIEIPFLLSFLMYIYFVLSMIGGIYTMFLNGVGRLRVQLIQSIFGAILFIPITYILIEKVQFGLESLVLAMIISNLGPFLAPIQYSKIMSGNDKGIWGK